ncbi:uncharacterized protein K441DRAFT_717894 [Cenococcum geophilum 1.58]|uniref:uncharacterized protein n=1 Tax=Cenococcum geophilum 1.58 TaxID=794803 RepID=UPI00358F70EA|nr:hypothetical protein K441DRAFT_717894 [Cenococcum geophilum 1.58]
MLPHTTHLCQPLNVIAVLAAYAEGCTDYNKMEFLNAIHSVRMKTFKRSTILSAFAQTGIVPFNPSIVINKCPLPSPSPAQPSTPPQVNWNDLTTLKTARSLKLLGDHIMGNWEDNSSVKWTARYIRASQAIAIAGDIQNQALKRTHAANIVREEARKDARKQLDHIGPLHAGTARRMLIKKANETLEEAKAALKARRIKAIKKHQKAEHAAAVAHRRAIRQANKALGIKTPRFRKNG